MPSVNNSRRWVRIVAPVAVLMLLLVGWQLTCSLGNMPATILPTPSDTFARLWRDLTGSKLLEATGVTLAEALAGCLLASAVALPMAYLIAHSSVAEAAASPFVAASQAIPAVSIAPLLGVWLGFGTWPIIVLCALMVFFPMALTTTLGFRQLPRDIIEAAMLDGANRAQLLRHIEWPLARVAALTGLRNGFTLSITGAVVGEFVMGGRGLGEILSVQSHTYDTSGLFATIIVLCVLSVAIYFIMLAAERLADPLRVATSTSTEADLG
jgi:NitT/TauT family transport system permease protein